MQRSLRGTLLAAVLLVLTLPALSAQTTGTPVFHAPYRAFQKSELGASLSDFGDVALEGFYGFGSGKNDFGIRAGFASYPGDNTNLLVGADFRSRVVTHTQDFPLDGALTIGFGATLGDAGDVFLIPVGLSLGRRIDLENSSTSFVPYVQPVIAPAFGEGDSDVLFSVGLGVDIRLGRAFDLRLSGGIGDIDGVAISFAWVR